MKCDFAIPAHDVPRDSVIIVGHDEVKQYASAYAQMVWDTLPPYLQNAKEAFLAEATQYAQGNPVLENTFGQHGDWCACKEHHSQWETYKKRLGAVNA